MGVPNKQIGWSTESNLLWDILKKISQLTKVTSSINNLTVISVAATLPSASWTLVGGLYEQDISNSNITSSSIVYIVPENSTIQIVIDAVVLPKTDSSNGSVKVYSQFLPSGDIDVTLNIWN